MDQSSLAPVTSTDVMGVSVRWSRRVVCGALLATVVARVLPETFENVVVLTLVGLGLIAGLPHGAVDHRLAAQMTRWPAPLVALGYALAAVLTWVLLVLAGPPALAVVLGLSLAHFALGELEVLRATTAWRPSRPVAAAVAVAGTGALLLPLARSGGELSAVAASISPELGSVLTSAPERIALAILWTCAATVAVVTAARARQSAVVIDVLLIGALGALAPPLVAFAIWFGGWHGLRHCARLLCVDEQASSLIARGDTRRAVGALVRVAIGPSVAAAVVLVVLVLVTVAAPDPAAAVGTALVVLLALTLPHMVVVMGVDRRLAAARRG